MIRIIIIGFISLLTEFIYAQNEPFIKEKYYSALSCLTESEKVKFKKIYYFNNSSKYLVQSENSFEKAIDLNNCCISEFLMEKELTAFFWLFDKYKCSLTIDYFIQYYFKILNLPKELKTNYTVKEFNPHTCSVYYGLTFDEPTFENHFIPDTIKCNTMFIYHLSKFLNVKPEDVMRESRFVFSDELDKTINCIIEIALSSKCNNTYDLMMLNEIVSN